MDVSIIIVNYNSFKLLQDCIESIFKHSTGCDFEIIVIDNNSSIENIDDVVSDFGEIILIKNKKNVGFGAANNQGLRIAKGKYILFLNNDTILLENSLKKVFDFAETLNEDLIIGCKLLNEDKSVQHSVYDFPSLLNVFTSNFFLYSLFPKSKLFNKYHLMNRRINETTEVDVVTGAFLFGTKNKLQEIGGFDKRFFFYNEETDLCYRFKRNGGKIYYYPGTSVVHLKGGTAKTISWFAHKNQSVSTIKFFQKHFSEFKYISALVFHYLGLLIRIPIFLLAGLITLKGRLIIRSLYHFKLLFIYPRNLFKDKKPNTISN
ncbi:MAG: glycosyltransferase family 2 protein [Ignavibacteria bacterium]|nr:MAG: glycosyltransferase family 2 protein [Ignavibacteria bacterium]